MIKLFTLENLSAFSSDAVYKACLSLDSYGVTDESIYSFESYDALLESACVAAEKGDYVIIAVENNDYNDVKRDLAARFMLDEFSSPVLAETISQFADLTDRSINMEAQCTVPKDASLHISYDGLYSGFSVRVLNGVCTMFPLDFSRIDNVLQSYITEFLNIPVPTEQPAQEQPQEESGLDFKEPVSKMVYSLIQVDKHVAVATSEATMWIYNLYDKIDGLSEVVNFVEIIDPENEPSEQPSDEDEAQPFGVPDEESQQESEQAPEKEEESPSAKTIRHAREAMVNMEADFGAAISEVYSCEEEDGSINYFAFVAVADKKSTKAKKINTKVAEEAELLLPHCVTVLCETVCQKVDAVSLLGEAEGPEQKKKGDENKKLSKGMIAFAAAVLLVAIISPIIIVNSFFKSTTTQPSEQVIATGDIITTGAPLVTETTTAASELFPGITTADASATTSLTDPVEPAATEVSVQTTTPNVSSTKGTFTFYVFGYGHGVGMSQNGANYLASLGSNYAQILANYYYGTTLVSGDTYPETVTYNGTQYKMRDYLAGVLEGEMGSSFLPEALKAQAVAAYTFAKYYGYTLTTESNAYNPSPSQACYDAVDEVMKNGLYISYGGQTALTPFHAISAGLTSSYYNAWGGTALPYLRGGRPSYGDYNATNFKSTYSITSEEFKSLVTSKNLGITLSGDPATWISVLSHDACINDDVGYVASISVGGKIMTGNEFRIKVLDGKIRSHCFMVVYTPDAS